MMRHVDVLIIGGGSAGMAAACAAHDEGAENVLLVERHDSLGGILQQCIHNGFGVHRFNEDMTGVEYARRSMDMVRARSLRVMTGTFAVGLEQGRVATLVHPDEGMVTVKAKAIVLAMGCRERTRASLSIPGCRGAGIFTAGAAQRFMNIEGFLPGREIVILGSGDIGLIMARQLACESAVVKQVVEIMPYSSGLARNIAQCLDDFSIPVAYSTIIVDIHGRERVEGVTIARVDDQRRPVSGTEEMIACDTLLISAGLIPENELSQQALIALSASTGGALVDNLLQTSQEGVFSCGNVLHVHDLVDNVSLEAEAAGVNAARFALGKLGYIPPEQCVQVHDGDGVRGVTPQLLRPESLGNAVTLMFRPSGRSLDCRIEVEQQGKVVHSAARRAVTPGEMERLKVPSNAISPSGGPVSIRIVPASKKTSTADCVPAPNRQQAEEGVRTLVCIHCPAGCRIRYERNGSGLVSLSGNQCRRGSEYVHQEMVNPMRIVTCVVPLTNAAQPLSVKTSAPIPKHLYRDVIASTQAARISAPVKCGDVIIADVCGTGVSVVATQDVS